MRPRSGTLIDGPERRIVPHGDPVPRVLDLDALQTEEPTPSVAAKHVEVPAAAGPTNTYAEWPTVIDLVAHVGETCRAASEAGKMADACQHGIQRPRLIAVRGGRSRAAIGAPEFGIDQAALGPCARPVVVVGHARCGRGPAPLCLLLMLHRKAEAAMPREPAEPVDCYDAPPDQHYRDGRSSTRGLALRALGRSTAGFTPCHRNPSCIVGRGFSARLRSHLRVRP